MQLLLDRNLTLFIAVWARSSPVCLYFLSHMQQHLSCSTLEKPNKSSFFSERSPLIYSKMSLILPHFLFSRCESYFSRVWHTSKVLCGQHNQSHVGLKATRWCDVDGIDYLSSINPHTKVLKLQIAPSPSSFFLYFGYNVLLHTTCLGGVKPSQIVLLWVLRYFQHTACLSTLFQITHKQNHSVSA